MSATARFYSYFQVDVDGEFIEFGSLSSPQSLTIDGECVRKRFTVEALTSQLVFDVDTDLADFDFLLLAADLDVVAEFVVDEDNDVGIGQLVFPITGSGTAGQYGIPLILAADDSYANYTISFAGGTLDVIERVTVKNLDTRDNANVLLIAGT